MKSWCKTLAPAVISAPGGAVSPGWGWELCLDLGLDLVEPNLFAYAPAFKEDEGWVEAKWPEKALLLVDDSIIPVAGRERSSRFGAAGKSTGAGYLIIAEAQLRAEEEQELNWPRFAGIDSFGAYQLDLPTEKLGIVNPGVISGPARSGDCRILPWRICCKRAWPVVAQR